MCIPPFSFGRTFLCIRLFRLLVVTTNFLGGLIYIRSEVALDLRNKSGTEITVRRYWDIIWKSQGGIMVNGVPMEVPRLKPKVPQAPRVFGRRTFIGTPFTMIAQRLFNIVILLATRTCKEVFLSANGLPRVYHDQHIA